MDERQPADDIAAMGAPASPDALKEIVARHHRGRTRTLGIALAIALVIGPAAGWAIGQSGGGGQQVATSSQPDGSAPSPQANAPAGSAGGAPATAAIPGPDVNLVHLFTRTTTDGITIRAYMTDPPPPTTDTTVQAPKGVCTTTKSSGTATAQANSGAVATANASSGSTGSASGSAEGGQVVVPPEPPQGSGAPGTIISGTPSPCPGIPPVCKSTPSVLSEFSSDAAVGQNFDAVDKTQPSDSLSHLSVSEFGVREGTPAVTVTVQTGPGVATVRLRTPSGATDQMAPNKDVAVLAVSSPAPPPDGTVVEALDASGKVLASTPLNGTGMKTGLLCGIAGNVAIAPAPASPPITR